MAKTLALIVAAGRGHRFGGALAKQYVELDGRPILRHTAEALAAHPAIDGIRVVIHPDDRTLYDQAMHGFDAGAPIDGGETRQDSVRLGLDALAAEMPDYVLIHDAARPFIDRETVGRVIEALERASGAVPVLPLVDTIKRVDGERITGTEDRAHLWRAQTPQGFRFTPILKAHHQVVGQNLTDDAAVGETAGLDVVWVEGNDANIKITTGEDLNRSAKGGPGMETRTGFGLDVHRFCEGDQVMLCGVAIPHSHSLEGHSDADVALHALTDALLGAIGAGDIGQHFPPSDAQWRGAPSDQFARHAVRLIEQLGGRIVNVDVTLICESPKVGPYRPAMGERLAEILGLDVSRINIKATTTERLGFAGRREGIAAQAVANVELARGS